MTDVVAQFAERIRAAAAGKRPLRLRGGGSKDFYGGALAGEILDTRAHTGIVSYEPTELVVTARCGTPLAELEAALATNGQMLAFEPPHFGAGATLGGCVAAGLSGPRRASAGALRDFVLGARILDGRARELAFGGQVMKNVAGYDVSRLLAGSLGTLGLILETSLKVLPRPAAEATLRLELGEEQALERPAAHREDRVGRFLDDDGARDLVADPDRMRRRDHHRLAVRRIAQARARRSLERAGDLASGGERVVGDGLVEILARARNQKSQQSPREVVLGLPLCFVAPQAAGEREHAQIARHHPDARGRALHASKDLADFLGLAPSRGLLAVDDQRGLAGVAWLRLAALGGETPQLFFGLAPQVGVAQGGRTHQAGTVVQRGGDGARGTEQRLLLAFEEKALHLAHVLVARPWQHQEHQGDERELGAKAEPGKERREFQWTCSAAGFTNSFPLLP